ncbi:hypothetical protein HOC11_04050 [archaeon]|nr:hypothetical protein [archaeon]
MKKIILDTNFLLIPYHFKVDIFSEIDRIIDDKYEILILEGIIDELNNIIEKQTGKHVLAAKMAMTLIKQKHLKTINISGTEYIDDSIVNISDEMTVVATQDKELKKRLKSKNIKIIVLRNKKYLEIV